MSLARHAQIKQDFARHISAVPYRWTGKSLDYSGKKKPSKKCACVCILFLKELLTFFCYHANEVELIILHFTALDICYKTHIMNTVFPLKIFTSSRNISFLPFEVCQNSSNNKCSSCQPLRSVTKWNTISQAVTICFSFRRVMPTFA